MIHFLNSQYESNTLEELKAFWIKETRSEERKSAKRWERKQQRLESYEKEFSYNDYNKIKKNKRPNQNYHQNRNTSKYPIIPRTRNKHVQ